MEKILNVMGNLRLQCCNNLLLTYLNQTIALSKIYEYVFSLIYTRALRAVYFVAQSHVF